MLKSSSLGLVEWVKNGEFIIMNKILIALVLVAVVSAGPQFEEFLGAVKVGQQCSNPVNAYTVTQFNVVPFPPTKGVTVTSTSIGTFNSPQTVTGISVDVLLNGRKFYSEVVPESGTFAAGQVGTFVYTQAVPGISPKGNYDIQGGIVNSNKVQLNCWEVSFTLN